jgi:hypothetical protein
VARVGHVCRVQATVVVLIRFSQRLTVESFIHVLTDVKVPFGVVDG